MAGDGLALGQDEPPFVLLDELGLASSSRPSNVHRRWSWGCMWAEHSQPWCTGGGAEHPQPTGPVLVLSLDGHGVLVPSHSSTNEALPGESTGCILVCNGMHCMIQREALVVI